MYFLTLCLSFLFLSCYETAKPPGLEFSTTPLGHNSLLVIWDPNQIPDVRHTRFKVSYQLVPERVSRDLLRLVEGVDGQFKMPALSENAEYRISIKMIVTTDEATTEDEYFIAAKTGIKSNIPPAKPSFKYSTEDIAFSPEKGPALKIRWLPCGTENNCNNQPAGAHFIVRYRALDSFRQFQKIEFIQDYEYIINLLATKKYEVKVVSVLGEYETESDPQLIEFRTYSSSVKSFNIISLSNTSVLISWEPPAILSSPIRFYMIAYSSPNSGSLRFDPDPNISKNLLKVELSTDHWQAKLTDLTPETQFTFYILPETVAGPGFESRTEFTPHAYENYFPLATPDFNYKILSNCSILIQWLPCGSGCRNLRPGSSFSVRSRDNAGATTSIVEEKSDYVILEGRSSRTYDVYVQSVDGTYFSEHVAKRIEISSCPF